MSEDKILPAVFFQRPVLDVAHDLLGKRLVRIIDGQRVSGMVTEVEAYDGEQDKACHARSGKSSRNYVMYGPSGRSYVYFVYGMHWMLNCVCGNIGYPAAVLFRALYPIEGLETITRNRKGIHPKDWCSGPARLTKALGIDQTFNNIELTDRNSGLFIEELQSIPEEGIIRTPRIGIQYAGEPWASLPWRFLATSPEQYFQKGFL